MKTEKSENAQETPEDLGRVADTIEAAAGITGYSESFLQRLKAQGCLAFRHGRVHIDELESYYAENAAACEQLERECDEVDGLDADIKRERVRKFRIANDQEEGKVIRRDFAARRTEMLAGELKEIWRVYMETEQPRLLAGRICSEEEIRQANAELFDRICKHFEAGTAWTK